MPVMAISDVGIMKRLIISPMFWITLASAQDYTVTARVNPVNVYAGYPLTIEVDVQFTAPPYSRIYPVLKASELGIEANPWCGIFHPVCWGAPPFVYNSAATSRFWVVVTPSSSTLPGNYTVTLTATSNALVHTLALPINVVSVPRFKLSRRDTPVVRAPRLATPPLPRGPLARYKAYMLHTESPNSSAARCDPAHAAKYTWSFGIEQQAWYYDGALVYFEIADYTGDPKWKACALSIASAYKAYALSGVTGWRVFTQGLRRAFEETGDTTYRDAIVKLTTTGSPYAVPGGDPSDSLIRETAYILRAYTDAHLVGQTPDPAAVKRSLNWLLGMGDTLFSGAPMRTNALEHQSFYDGLMAEALTYYYDNWDRDPRIPPAIKKLCDWTWMYGWDDVNGKIMWDYFPTSNTYPHWCGAGNGGCQQYSTQLINFLTPAYWWFAKFSGDDSYRQKGDRMFAHGVDVEPWSGKEFCQIYKWSLTGLAWRQQIDPVVQELQDKGPVQERPL
jgi:hypothetical protein